MAKPFTQLSAVAAPIMRANIDTDVIIRIERLEGPYPHLAPLLATPCDLQIREKPLRRIDMPHPEPDERPAD